MKQTFPLPYPLSILLVRLHQLVLLFASQKEPNAALDYQRLIEATDATLMERVGRGDSDAFAELVARHEQWARTLSGRILGDFQEAEDVTQEVFLKLWVGAAKWQPRASLKAWLATLLTRQSLDFLRKKRPQTLDDQLEIPCLTPGVREQLERESNSKRLAYLINQLPPRQRTALMLFYNEELSQREGAAAMEMNEKAFESLLQRGRAQLKAAWRNQP